MRSPCFKEFIDELLFPSGDFGPVDLREFFRLIWLRFRAVMLGSFGGVLGPTCLASSVVGGSRLSLFSIVVRRALCLPAGDFLRRVGAGGRCNPVERSNRHNRRGGVSTTTNERSLARALLDRRVARTARLSGS